MNDHGKETSLACGFPMDLMFHLNGVSKSLMHRARHAITEDTEGICFALLGLGVELAIIIILYFDV